MTYRPDFIDELSDYAAKMRQEYMTVDDVLDQAIEHAAKIRVARKLFSEAEQGRLAFSNALQPFLPEPAPVALQSAPAPYSDPDLSDIYSDNGNDPFDMPQYLRKAAR